MRTFVTVAELGTVSKAAVHLRVAQPALSRQIGDLEQELGFKLFDRVGRRLLLTGEGEQLLNDCRGLLNYASAVNERAQLLRRGHTGVLKVAGSPQMIESAFSNFLPRYAKRYPDVQVKLIEAIGADTLAMLERGEVHLGQHMAHAVQPGDRRFASHPLEPVELLAACHPSMPIAKSDAIDIKRLAPYPLLLEDPAFVIRRLFDAACRLASLQPNIMFESRAPHTLLAMAEAGQGVAVIPSALRTHRYKVRIVGITHQSKPLRQPLVIFWDKRRPLPRYATAFCEMFAEHVSEVFPITRPSIIKVDAGQHRRVRRKPG
ncbi:LysR family transcriptional regulator [Variibacter gotjawalensis]|uniref:LysR family transcriptional regulator n=1 Tax=Variibacter gotjawalensis TaxID=1333996 RepID=UPI001D5168D1|nr:LysR family transcriptional regulator [Variibacter gotjawalensis]NIK45989.1 DNA-binding transcriptional LysR family regulator [Variibacter gotjawalensis]